MSKIYKCQKIHDVMIHLYQVLYGKDFDSC